LDQNADVQQVSRSHTSPDMCTVVFMCVYVVCDLKLCVNYVELEIGAVGEGLFPRGKL
jgi:hypothetical protein